MSDTNNNRREFLKKTGMGLLWAVPATMLADKLLVRSTKANAQTTPPAGGALVMVKEADPQAKTLGYHEDAAKVDTKKWPKRAGAEGAKQFCYNCMFYKFTGDAKTSKSAPCTIFANKGVMGKGWCNSWTQNPAVKG